MPLSIITTAGAADANAYIDRDTAVVQAQYRVGGSGFVDSLTPEQQVQAIVTAARALDAVPWKGERVDDVQAMAFPRTGFSQPIPKWLAAANLELAISYVPLFAAGADDALNPTVQRTIDMVDVGVGKVKVEFGEGATTELEGILEHFPRIVRLLIAPHVYVEQTTWGMSTAVRSA